MTSSIRIITAPISRAELRLIAQKSFGDMVKAVVDIERSIMAIGGELHADEEAVLLEQGSKQENLWGINLYPAESGEDWIEFDSMINIRPSQHNQTRSVENPDVRKSIVAVVQQLIHD